MKVGPEFSKPGAEVAQGWADTGNERIKALPADYRAWWKEFNDPALDRIIVRAYSQNLSLMTAGVRVLEARAQLGVTTGSLYPQSQYVDGSLTFNRTSERSTSAAFQRQHTYWQDEANFNISWEIDFWGKFRRAVEAADAAFLAAIADYDSTLVTLTADAASSYIIIRTLEKRLAIARENARTQEESLQLAQTRFQGGVTSERDVEQARTSYYNTLATIPGLQAQLTQAKNALSVLMGYPPNELAEYLSGGSGEIPAPPPQIAVGIPADLLRRRPDVRSAEQLAAAQSARIGVAKADLFPAFSLTGSIGFLSSTAGQFNLASIATMQAGNISAGPAVRWDILNYGRITNNVRVQDARFQELLLSYRNTVLQAQQEVENALAGFARAEETAQSLGLNAGAAKRSLQLAMVQYRQGSTDFTTVLTAQQSLLTAQDSLAGAIGNISGNLVGVYRALGGGWLIREGHDFVPDTIKEAMARRTSWGRLLTPAAHTWEEGSDTTTIRLPDW